MPNFRWQNWITDDQRDLETIARHSPHEDDRLEAMKLLRDSQVLREMQHTLHGDAAMEAGRLADNLEDD